MKKTIQIVIIVLFILPVTYANGQRFVAKKDSITIQKTFLWGIFKYKIYQSKKEIIENKGEIVQKNTDKSNKSISDKCKMKQVSIFWGAIKWSE